MDKRGQRKAIKHAQPCVIGDANRWMLQKEFHHLYPFVAATIFAMPNKTGAAARSTSQSHMARNRRAAVLSSSTDEMPEPKLRWRKQVVSLLQRAQQRLYTVEARA